MSRPPFRVAALVLAASAVVAGCGSDPAGPDPLPVRDDPTPSGSSRSPVPSASSASSATVPPAPSASGSAGAGPLHWKGSLAATSPTTFGGSGYCDYRITLEQVKVDLLQVDADIVSGNVTATAVEEIVSSCGNATPYAPNAHDYVLTSASTLPSGIRHLELAPVAANHPQAMLVVEGQLTGASPSLTLAWHRIDVGAPLDWRVDTAITVAPR